MSSITTKARRFVTLSLVAMLAVAFLPLNSQALTISPVTQELTADPGDQLSGEMVLTNDQNETITFTSSVQEFEALGESGTPNFLDSTDDIASWIEVQDQVTLAPNERATITYAVSVPSDASPGDHAAGLLWTRSGEGDVALTATVGTLVFVRVSGTLSEVGEVVEFSAADGKTSFSTLPVDMLYRFQNTGNTRLTPVGNVVVKNMFGSTKATLDANVEGGSVLPGGIRQYDASWDPAGYGEASTGFFDAVGRQLRTFALGSYTAEVTVAYGSANQVATEELSFFVFPWQLLLLVLILVILVIVIWMWVKGSNGSDKKNRK